MIEFQLTPRIVHFDQQPQQNLSKQILVNFFYEMALSYSYKHGVKKVGKVVYNEGLEYKLTVLVQKSISS